MLRKVLSFVVAIGLTASVLSGCGSTAKNTNANEGAKESVKNEQITITRWTTGKADEFSTNEDQEFLKTHPNIKFNDVIKQQDWSNDYYQAVAAGNAPDFVAVSFTSMDKLIKAGVCESLNNYAGNWSDKQYFYDKYLDMFSKDGTLYGIPNEIYPMMFAYNKQLFKEAGLSEPPKTWDEALEYAKKLTVPDKHQYGYALLSGAATEWFFQYYVWQAGGDLTKKNSDGTLALTFTDPAVIKAADYYKELVAGKVTPSDLTLKFSDLLKDFAASKCAMMPFAGDWINTVVKQGMKLEDIGLMPFPAGPSGKSTSAISGSTFLINPKTTQAKKDAAWEAIKFFTTKDHYTRYYKYLESKGAVSLTAMPRKDVNISEIIKIDPEYDTVLKNALESNRDEFSGKAVVGKYVDSVVQKIVADPSADPEKEFAKAQQLGEKEALEKYNSSLPGTNK